MKNRSQRVNRVRRTNTRDNLRLFPRACYPLNRHMRAIFTIVGAAVLTTACATPTFLRDKPTNVEQLYNYAVEDMNNGLFEEAVRNFVEVKAKYPYTRFAALADLRIADTHFKAGKYSEAIDAYRNFLKYHPKDEEGAYTMMRVADAYKQQIPEDWWFLPPSAEKDQGYTKLAISAYRDMLARYPKSPHVDTARASLKECRKKLGEHELYVARFYFEREEFAAAAGRAEGLLKTYGGIGLDADALWLAAEARSEIGELDKARASWERLAKEFPDTAQGRRAAARLKPSAKPAAPPTAEGG